jgi:hypothetical protein
VLLAPCRYSRAQEVLLFPAMKPEVQEAGAGAGKQQAAGDAAAAAVQQLSVS